ncbi:GNAT domain-containing protein [Peziza echinospora]|nr:GNAT domain-containing protein [Peziza echinospora]
MKLNENTALLSSKILLVPYDRHHVPTYHQWMEDPHLRTATASEMLSLEEEYNMQRDWRQDADKLTFLAAFPPPIKSTSEPRDVIVAGVDDAPERMFGDVNLFFFEGSEDEDDDDEVEDEDNGGRHESSSTCSASARRQITGEVELMIAPKAHRGHGLGKATLLLFLAYVLRNRIAVVSGLPISNPANLLPSSDPPTLTNLRAKINQNNPASLHLFQSVGFRKKSHKTNYFGEFDLYVDRPLDEYRTHIEDLLVKNGMGGWRELEYVQQ